MDAGSIVETILGVGASAASGGLFGLFGSLVGVWAKYKQRKLEREIRRDEMNHEVRLQELQMQARAEETEQEIALASAQGAWAGLEQSLVADASVKGTGQITTNIKALFRPFLTVSLWGLAGIVFFAVLDAITAEAGVLSLVFDKQQLAELVKYMVYTVFFAASTATVWWFGDRALTPPQFKHR